MQPSKFQYFMVTRQRFHTEQVQGNYFKNGFHKEKVIASNCPQSPQAKPSPSLYIFTKAKLLPNSLPRQNSSITVYLFFDS